MKRKLIRILDLVFLVRPIILVPVWAFTAFGLFGYSRRVLISPPLSHFILMAALSLSYASVYVINQIADYEVDKSNGGFPLLIKGDIPIKSANICAFLCALISVLVPLVMKNMAVVLFSALTLVLGIMYSCKPFSFSGRPFLDFLSNALFAFFAFGSGWCMTGGTLSDTGLYTTALPYFFLMCAGSISSTLPDMSGDKNHEKITTAVFLGADRANYLALGALIMSAVLSTMSSDQLAFWCAVLATPFYVLYAVHPTDTTMELTYKAGGGLTVLASTLVLPVLIPIGLLVFFSTWLYFRKRHHVTYPSLVSE
ncbi:MAG: UbiA family prenyltransferase [Chitinispirillaceae bacterium]